MKTSLFPVSVLAGTLFTVLCLPLQGQINVTTHHYDPARSGQNTHETILTTANVNSAQFGKLFSVPLDGYVYAEPLYMPNVKIGGATHNVLYVATEHDSLYAIDADKGTIYWHLSFINPAVGITSVPYSDVACSDLVPEIGISSTPALDPSSGTIYLITKTKENGIFVQRLHAIDIVSHAEKFGGPVVISATVNGTGSGSVNGKITFDSLRHNNRSALLLENGHVVAAWASLCEKGPFHGWVMSYNATTLAKEGVINLTPTGYDAGVWMSGDGVAADGNGNLYVATGNGSYSGTASNNYGDSIVKLAPPSGGTFAVTDWFTPFNQSSLSGGDTDLGSGGILLLPDLPSGSAHQHLLVQMGKEGTIYLIDRDKMGRFCSTCTGHDNNIVQEIPGATTGVWGAPGYWKGSVYWVGSNDHLKQYSFNANGSGVLSTSPISETTKTFGFGTGAPVISSNGTSNGILWILGNGSFNLSCCQVLYAYDAGNLSRMLYNSNQAPYQRDVPGGAVKFTSPIVANGKVYVGSQSRVSAFGLLAKP